MGQFYVDRRMYREPALLEPGNKPTGSVVLDFNNGGLTDGLVGFWPTPLQHGTTVRDLSNNNHHAVLSDDLVTASDPIVCSERNLNVNLQTDGSDNIQYLHIADYLLSGTGSFTIMSRFYATAATTAGVMYIVSGRGAGNVGQLAIYLDGSMKVGFIVGGLSLYEVGVGSTTVQIDEWNTACGVYDALTPSKRIYLNCKKDADVTPSGTRADTATRPMELGSDKIVIDSPASFWDRNFKGYIGWAGIWDRPLSETEVISMTNHPYQILSPL